MSSSLNKKHRAPAKSTPFAAAIGGDHGSSNGNVGGGGGSKARMQRSAMTTTLRKAKRGQTVARKRHMTMNSLLSSSSSSTTGGIIFGGEEQTNSSNPYASDSRHAKETIEAAKSIIARVNKGGEGGVGSAASTSESETLSSLSSLVERMCILLTPDDKARSSGGSSLLSNYGGSCSATAAAAAADGGGVSYDSSVAGMAANSLLSQFLDEGSHVVIPTMATQQQQGQLGGQTNAMSHNNNNNNLAFLLADALAHILDANNNNPTSTSSSSCATATLRSIQIRAAIALNQLAATEPPPPMASAYDQEHYSPYGHPNQSATASMMGVATSPTIPTSWCHVLVNSRALSALVHKLLPYYRNNNSNGTTTTADGDDYYYLEQQQLAEKCAWAVGNLAGDSEMAREALRGMGAASGLIGCISSSLGFVSSMNGQQQQQLQQQQQQQQQQRGQCLMDLIRNSVWALTNLVRAGGISASELLPIDTKNQHGLQQTMMSGDDRQRPYLTKQYLAMLIMSPEMFTSAISGTANNMNGGIVDTTISSSKTNTCWKDIALETCWFLSFLTRNSDDAVQYLSSSDDGSNCCIVVSALLSRLVCSTDATSRQLLDSSGISSDTACAQDVGCLIPCIRTLRNTATSWDNSKANLVLELQTNLNLPGQLVAAPVPNNRPAEWALVKLISLGTLGAGSSVSAIACEAASLSGSLLYSAGADPEWCLPTVACRTLIPALCSALCHPLSTFEFKREAVWALWTAAYFPPELYGREEEDDNVCVAAAVMQRELLAEIIRVDRMAETLVGMANALDSDVMEPSMRLINLLIRRDELFCRGNNNMQGLLPGGKKKMSTHFEESGLVDALWRICDRDSEESEVAELAANILDDFYEDEEEGEEENSSMLEPSSLGGQFQFQAPATVGMSGIPEGGFNFGSI